MDRRSLLKMVVVAGAAAAMMRPLAGEAMPVAQVPPVGSSPAGSAVATDADMAAAASEKTYWVWRRRRPWHRRTYWRRRHYWHRRYWRRRIW